MSKKIIIIDDALDVRDLIKAILEAQDYQVATAIHGIEALKMIKADPPDLIIADFLMPEMDGFVFFKELKKHKHLAGIPVIILTARGRMSDSFQALGVDGFLVKPIDTDRLLNMINNLMSTGHRRESRLESEQEVSPSPLPMKHFFEESVEEQTIKKALIFGSEDDVLEEMTSYLEKNQWVVTTLKDERDVIAQVAGLKPNLILLQLKEDTLLPLDEIIFSITIMVRERAQDINLDPYHPRMIIYKLDQQMKGIASKAEDIVDTENLIDRCRNNGNADYMGVYSAALFGFKIEEILRRDPDQ